MKDLKKYIGWAILGFFFPIVGLILFIVWRETEKEKSKVTLMGTLIGVGIYFIITIFATILLLFIVPKMDSRKVIYNNNNNNNNNNNKNNNISNEDPTACTGNFKKDGYKYEIDWLLSIIVGGFFLYSLFFCGMMLARRQIEFLFLFVISPIVFATSIGNKERRQAVVQQLVSLMLQGAVIMLIISLTAIVMGQINETTFFSNSFKDIVKFSFK